MSGTKAFALTAGVSPVVLATGAAVLGGAAAGILLTKAFVYLSAKGIQAYQERQRREAEAAVRREKGIQQRIAQIKARNDSSSGQARVAVKLPAPVTSPSTPKLPETTTSVFGAAERDAQRRVEELKSRLPKIRSEYQALIDQQLLDPQTVQKAIQQTEQALNAGNLTSAEVHLQALDDARIQVMQQLRAQWQAQIQYVQERLDGLRSRIPQTVAQDLQASIEQAKNNWQQLSDADIEALHQQVSAYEAQAAQIQEVADNLVKSWSEVGYIAQVAGIDDGDVTIEVETHDSVNTQIRVQFDGQQIDLFGPPEETNSCATRTMEALKVFQEQGYQLEWTSWDGQPIPQEWRQLYSATSQEQQETPTSEFSMPPSSQRRLESQGY